MGEESDLLHARMAGLTIVGSYQDMPVNGSDEIFFCVDLNSVCKWIPEAEDWKSMSMDNFAARYHRHAQRPQNRYPRPEDKETMSDIFDRDRSEDPQYLRSRKELARKLNRDRPSHDGGMSSQQVTKRMQSSGNMGPTGASGVPGSMTTPGAVSPNKPPTDKLLTVTTGDSTVIETIDGTIIETWSSREAMSETGEVGKLGFAGGIAYIMTKQGWVNLGEALSRPEPITDRRGAIKAQKARNA